MPDLYLLVDIGQIFVSEIGYLVFRSIMLLKMPFLPRSQFADFFDWGQEG
jgi:hypothetical protein